MSSKNVSVKTAFKSGLWYTISSFLFKGIGFIVAPIFIRLMSKGEYGSYSNITSWVTLISVFTACELYTSVVRAKLDFDEDLESYAFSVLVLSSIITVFIYLLFIVFQNQISIETKINPSYFHIIFGYLFFSNAYYVYTTLERARYRYKSFSILTGVVVVASSVLSILLMFLLKNRLTARVYGQYVPYVVLGFFLFILLAKKGKKIKIEYIKYGLRLSLPLVPHILSMHILSISDKAMITRIHGEETTALYEAAFLITHIAWILFDAMNKAWAPWFLDSLKSHNEKAIKKAIIPYFLIFVAIVVGILLAGPEVMLIIGGRKYIESINVLPPLIVALLFQFAYTMFVQVEFYEKKMSTIAFSTSVAAIVNVILNLIFIPKIGYYAAGYTTLIGYIILFFIHFATVFKMGYLDIFKINYVLPILFLSIILIPITITLYNYTIIRYIVFCLYAICLIIILIKNFDNIKKLFSKNKT